MGGAEPDIIIQDAVMNEVKVEIDEDIEMAELVYALEVAFPATYAQNHVAPPRWITFSQAILPTTFAIPPLPIAPLPAPQPPVLYDDEDTLTYYSDYSDSEYGNDEQNTDAPASVAVPQASGPVTVLPATPSPSISLLSPRPITPEAGQNAGAEAARPIVYDDDFEIEYCTPCPLECAHCYPKRSAVNHYPTQVDGSGKARDVRPIQAVEGGLIELGSLTPPSTASPQEHSDTGKQTASQHPVPASRASQSIAYWLSIRDIARIRSLPSHAATMALIAADAAAAKSIQEEEDVIELPRVRTEKEDDEYLQIEYCTPRRSTHGDQGTSSAPGGSKSN